LFFDNLHIFVPTKLLEPMTKFKIISWILKIFICFYILGSMAITYSLYTFIDHIGTPAASPSNFIFSTGISIPLMLLFAAGLYFIHQSCIMFVKRSYFNSKSAVYLKKGSYILATTALIWIIINIVNLDFSKDNKEIFQLVEDISYNILWIVISLALLGVADIIKKGEKIKRENDLTI